MCSSVLRISTPASSNTCLRMPSSLADSKKLHSLPQIGLGLFDGFPLAGNTNFWAKRRVPPSGFCGVNCAECYFLESSPHFIHPIIDTANILKEMAPGRGFEPLRPRGPHAFRRWLQACALPGLATPALEELGGDNDKDLSGFFGLE